MINNVTRQENLGDIFKISFSIFLILEVVYLGYHYLGLNLDTSL